MNDSRAAALRFTLVASAVVLAGLAHYFIRDGGLRWAITPLVLSVGCLYLATMRSSQEDTPPAEPEETEQESRQLEFGLTSPTIPAPVRHRRRWWLPRLNEANIGTGLIVLSTLLMYVSLRNFSHENPESLTLAWYSFGAAVVTMLAAVPTIDRRWSGLINRLRADGGIKIGLRPLAPWLTVLAIVVLGAGLRLYNLEDLPAGLWFDEADNLFQARQYARDPGQTPVYAPSTNLPTLFLLPIAAVIKLAGVDVTTPRLVAVAFGLLGIVATFVFVRHLMGTAAGLIGAFLVAVMRWDINWSRIGMHGITAVLFAALTGWLTLRAIRTERPSDYAFAGASLGLGMWFYTSFRLFPLVLAFILIYHLLVHRPPFFAYVVRVALLVLMAVFVAAPIVLYATDNSEQFFARTETTSVFTLTPREQWADQLRTSLVKHSMMFNREGDPNPRHNLPNAPMLDFVTGALFVLGFFFALTQRRNLAIFMLPFWVFLMVLPGVLTVPWEAPQSLRSILVIPAVAALVAYVLAQLLKLGRESPWPSVRQFSLPLVLGLLAIIAYLNVNFYFNDQANNPEVYAGFSTDETLMARSQVEQQRLGHTLWVSRQFLFGLTSTLIANHPRFEVIKAPETLPLDSTQVWMGASAYFEPREEGFWRVMQAYYPDGEYRAITPPNGGEPMYYSGFISREKLAERQGLEVRYVHRGRDAVGRQRVVQESVWHADGGPDEYPYEVSLEGSLHILLEGEYEFVLDGNVDAVVELDGQRILGAGKTRTKVVPAAGLHSIAIKGIVEGPENFIRVLWDPPDTGLEPIPFGRLYRGTVRPLGLAGRFYEGSQPGSIAYSMHTTPTMDLFYYDPVIEGPYFASWEGNLNVWPAGTQKFKVEGIGRIQLFIDDRLIVQRPPNDGVEVEEEITLSAGQHRIRIEYVSDSPLTQFEILWAPLGRPLEPIPIEAMTPASEHMLRIVE